MGVKPRKELEARGNKASSTDNYWRVEQGDIIVNKLLAWMGAIGISEYKGVTSPAYDILRHKENVNPYFYNYLFRNPIASREFKRHSRGIMDMRLRLYFTRFGDIKLPYPSIDEQNKIVEYLQFKLNRIDRFTRKKKQLIKLLNEQKAAIINQAVTKGIESNSRMKSSGIEWMGAIPEHWVVKRLKHITSIDSGYAFKSKYFNNDEGVPIVKIGNVQQDFSLEKCVKTTESISIPSVIVKKNDVLIALSGATTGKVCLVENDIDLAYLNQRVAKFNGNEFFYYVMSSELFKSNLLLKALGSAQENISTNDIKNLPVPYPSSKEQGLIVRYIKGELKQIKELILSIEKEITLTQEYKTTLIAEAVTGKIDVRDFQIPENQYEETYDDLEEELSLETEGEAEYQNEEIEE